MTSASFAHRFTELIRATERESGEVNRNTHNLFLINDDTVGHIENWLADRVRVFDLFTAMLTVDVIINHPSIEWARAIESNRRDDVFKAVRLESFQELLKTIRFQLENTVSEPFEIIL